MTAAPDTETPPGICWECRGPCLTFKGSEHGWRCRSCLDRYLNQGVARADKADAKRLAKQRAKVNAAMFGDLRRATPVAGTAQFSADDSD
jgi:hypothetical protein